MPEEASLPRIHGEAIASLDAFIRGFRGSSPLQPHQIGTYEDREFVSGWRLPISFADQVRNFHVLVTRWFPFLPPRIALVDRPPFLTWPHVEKDGVLCILQNNSTVSAHDPVGVLKNLLSRAVELVEAASLGKSEVDFEAEFNTYWNYESKGTKQCRSLLALYPGNRVVRMWNGTQFDIAADDEISIRNWLVRRYSKPQEEYALVEPNQAALIWISRPLHPSEYPRRARDLRVVLKDSGAMRTVGAMCSESAAEIRIILAAPSVNGPVLAGISVPNPRGTDVLERKTDPLRKGFRRGHVPKDWLAWRFLNSDRHVALFDVQRIDHDWIHGRGRDSQQEKLKRASVAILGCGSVGSAVAVILAKSGIGKLTLIDNESLTWPNISRHVLGAASVGRNKAQELARNLQENFPHLAINGFGISVGAVLESETINLGDYHIVVNVTADWGMTQALGIWRKSQEKGPAIVLGWLEGRACACHAVFTPDGADVDNGFGETGVPRFEIASWRSDPGLQEPACGAEFQPYGDAELSSAIGVIARLVIDSLLASQNVPIHRFWVGNKKDIYQSNGEWSAQWRAHPDFRDAGGLSVEQPWPPRISSLDGVGTNV